MCGIFALLNNNALDESVSKSFYMGKNRGPEFSKLKSILYNKLFLGFHRLAINGINSESNQPLTINNITLICNGEIYNYIELCKLCNITLTTQSDCEIIIHLYEKYGIEQTLQLLDGVFAFVLYDERNNDYFNVYVARDPYGVRPLYKLNRNKDCTILNNNKNFNTIGFASELKCLYNLKSINDQIEHFTPGTYSKLFIDKDCFADFKYEYQEKSYSSFAFNELDINMIYDSQSKILEEDKYNYIIHKKLCEAVKKRVVGTTDRPIACLLSGGLDSSLITALVKKYYTNKTLETYSIGLEGSEDLKYSQMVADYLGTKHKQIILTEDEFFHSIPEVIKAIESYDTTTVRASVGNYLIGKYIKENSNAKVIFNGDGSDELTGGYMYMHKAPDEIEFDRECRRLLKDIHIFDVLRSDKSISSHGLEPRTPFLDRGFVELYLSLPKDLRYHVKNNKCEKFLLRNAMNRMDPYLLPTDIVWRTKEAFSDGVSSLTRSWYEIIQEKIEKLCIENNNIGNVLYDYKYFLNSTNDSNPPQTLEQTYYRYLYDRYYNNTSNVVPYFWMPKYIESNDASARTLNIYNTNNMNNADKIDNIMHEQEKLRLQEKEDIIDIY